MEAKLTAYAVEIVRLCVWLLLLAAVFIPLERLFSLHRREIFRAAILTDLGYYFLSSLVPALLLSVPLAIVGWVAHRAVPGWFAGTVAAAPLWERLLAALLVGEVGFYWGHRWSHEIPLLWRFHAIHHSAEHLDYLVNTRAHPVDMVFTRLCGLVPLYVLGLGAPARGSASMIPILIVLAGTVWGFFLHANVRWRLGVVEWIVATPAFHHWHHTNDGPVYLNKNYAPMLPWIDRLFGTLYLPRDRHPGRYGIDQSMPSGLLRQLIEPFGSVRPRAERNVSSAAGSEAESSAGLRGRGE